MWYFRNDCRILKQKNPSEGSDLSSSKKREQQIRQQHNASCCPVTDVVFVKRLESQGNNILKTLVKCMTKTAEDSVKEAITRKQDQHILLKVQDTDLAAQEDITVERMTDTRKPSKTLKPLKN